MTDGPTTPPKIPTSKRRGIVNADVPSQTLATGLPDVGEGASGAHFARDAARFQAGEGHDEPADPDTPAAPANTDDRAG